MANKTTAPSGGLTFSRRDIHLLLPQPLAAGSRRIRDAVAELSTPAAIPIGPGRLGAKNRIKTSNAVLIQ
jgi:hypothetical protein